MLFEVLQQWHRGSAIHCPVHWKGLHDRFCPLLAVIKSYFSVVVTVAGLRELEGFTALKYYWLHRLPFRAKECCGAAVKCCEVLEDYM